MADTKLSALTATTTLAETDEFYLNNSGTSKKVTLANIRAALLGTSSFTAGDILVATSATAFVKLAAVATGKALVSAGVGASPVWGNTTNAMFSGTLVETKGGTGLSTYAVGDTIYSDATNHLAVLSGNTTTTPKALVQTGNGSASAAPAWTDLDTLDGGLSSAGIIARTGANARAARTLASSTDEFTVTNGSGASGAPTFDFLDRVRPGYTRFQKLVMSTTTGGASTLTLTALTNMPSATDYWGSTGTQLVEYQAVERGTGTLRWERGIGSLALSTLVLTRQKVLETWTGSALDNTSPAKLTLASSGVLVYMTAALENEPWAAPFMAQSGSADAVGMCSLHVIPLAAGAVVTRDLEYYTPFYWAGSGEINLFSSRCVTGSTGGAGKHAIYALGTDGFPGARIKDINSGAPWTLTATANVNTAVTGLWLPRGWYYTGAIYTGTTAGPTMLSFNNTAVRTHPCGTFNGALLSSWTKSGSYTTGLPSPASTGLSFSSGNDSQCFFWRSPNT